MKLWLCVLVLASTTFAHLTEAKSSDETPSEHNIHARGVDNIKVPATYATDVFKPIEITVEGQYYWERIYYIDNRGQNNPYKETRKITKSVTTSYSDLKKSIVDSSIKSSLNLDVGGVFDIITASVKGSLDTELTTSYQSTVERKSETHVTEELTREFTVGANSIGEMFRLVYKGPGVTYATSTISTDGKLPQDKVFITCRVKQIPLIKDIQVVYTDQSVERPQNLITESTGGSPDINKGFGGKYVWLVPVWTSNADKAVTNIQFVMQSSSNEAYRDLAAGTGGQYRYLKMLKDMSHTRIKRVGLLRSPKAKYIYGDRHKYGWDECTEDINSDRKGDWLHLCWNTITV